MSTESVELVGGARPVLRVDANSPTPVFQQIVDQIREAAVGGRLAAGVRLPAVRALAGELGVAVNTVAKAYRALESEGTVITNGRLGTAVAALADGKPSALDDAASAFIAAAREAGLTRDQTVGVIARMW